jgi:hypothetical protein
MTSHTARLYALVGAVLVFFVAWAAIAAHPWRTQTQAAAAARDPRLAALQAREKRLRAEALAVKKVVDRRWAVYRAQLALRNQEIKAIRAANAKAGTASLASASAPSYSAPSTPAPAPPSPSVRVVTLPPLTITRTS